MTSKQILDTFSETLMQDERILSPRERELLMSLLQNSKAVSSHNPEIQTAVNQAIANAIGETVAQRAFSLLGGSIVEQILAHSGVSSATEEGASGTVFQSLAPQPPTPTRPKPPEPRRPEDDDPPPPGPQPPGIAVRRRTEPGLHRAQQTQLDSPGSVAVLDAPGQLRQQCVVLDEFLAPQELDELIRFTVQHEAEFQSSEVISPSGEPGAIDYNHRRSRVLLDLGKHEQVILDRIRCVLPGVLEQLGIEEFPVTHTEVQITASNDGDFFRAHRDDSQELIASRRMTFVYFFHREPRQFAGGELRLYDSPGKGDRYVSTGSQQAGGYQCIVPQQNQIVLFPCSLLHEITPVKCPSQAFADSRFTLNGWLHK